MLGRYLLRGGKGGWRRAVPRGGRGGVWSLEAGTPCIAGCIYYKPARLGTNTAAADF